MSQAKFKNVFVSSIGGLLEMYDFSIYAFFAAILSQLFFPKEAGGFVALLSTFAIFASGYLARPIGAAFFGHLGDRYGRKSSLLWTIVIMASATTLIGIFPTWKDIAIAAPILLFLLRVIQGFAVGGDLPGAITFVAEHAKPSERGMDCSWIFFGVNVGLLLAMAASGAVTALLPHTDVVSFGWRIVFLSGLVIGAVGLYLRFRIQEPKVFVEVLEKHAAARMPLKEVFQQHKRAFVRAILVMVICAVIVGQLLYLPTYFHVALGMKFKDAIFLNAALTLLFSLMIPFFGHLSDRYGRRPIMFFATVGFVIFATPIYFWFQKQSSYWFDFAMFLMALFSAAGISVFPSLLSELFPTRVRYSGLALGYNISFALFCGTTPIVMTSLHHFFTSTVAPSFYLMLTAAISCVATIFIKESKSCDLHDENLGR